MSGKALFIDTTKCTACRGCQVACKEWHQNPATETRQYGNHQNPVDLSYDTYKLVRFSEVMGPDGKPRWYFFADQCRHCLEPPCMEGTDIEGAIVIDEATGAVIHTAKLSGSSLEDVKGACPFNIPQANANNIFAKCSLCVERVQVGLLPACVKTCPTGAMNFGDREKMVTLAKARLAARKKVNPNAELTGLDDLRVFYLLDAKPEVYWKYADASSVMKLNRMQAMKRMLRPFTRLTA